MVSLEGSKFSPDQERQELTALAGRLNSHFEAGGSVWDTEATASIRRFPLPILINIDQLVAEDHVAIDAPQAFQRLRQIGNVFVLSTNPDRSKIVERLQANGLMHPEMVVMSHPNFTSEAQEYDPYDNPNNYEKSCAEIEKLGTLFKKYFQIPLLRVVFYVEKGQLFYWPNSLSLSLLPKNHIWRFTSKDRLPKFSERIGEIESYYNAIPSAPFWDNLVPSNYNRWLVSYPRSEDSFKLTLARHPEKVIRTDRRVELEDIIVAMSDIGQTATARRNRYISVRDEFKRLENQYGIKVVRQDIVIGPNPDQPYVPIYYQVVDNIHGQNLKEKDYKKEEESTAGEKLDALYISLAQYLWDIYQNGGFLLDLFAGPRPAHGNNQFVYGRRSGEEEDNIWGCDVGANMVDSHTQNGNIINREVYGLIEMVEESEAKLGIKLKGARNKMIVFLSSIPPADEIYTIAFYQRRQLGDAVAEGLVNNLATMLNRHAGVRHQNRPAISKEIKRLIFQISGTQYQYLVKTPADLLAEWHQKEKGARRRERFFYTYVYSEVDGDLQYKYLEQEPFMGLSRKAKKAMKDILAPQETNRIVKEATQ